MEVYYNSESKVFDVEKIDFLMSIFKLMPLIDHWIFMIEIMLRLKLGNYFMIVKYKNLKTARVFNTT